MKSTSSAAPRNTNNSHPPLARNAQGHPIAMPEGAASWAVKRETRGRPKVIKGPDGHPYRVPLEATEDDLLETFGPGTYRLDALDALGNVIDYVTTVEIAGDEADDVIDDGRPSTSGGRREGVSDLRFALEALTQMARAQADSIRAVTEAQADWVKGLAHAKALPRNASYVAPPATPEPDEDDDQDDSEEEGGDDGSEPEPPSWAEKLAFQMAPAVTKFVDMLVRKYGTPPAQSAASPAPDAPPVPTAPPTPPNDRAQRNPIAHVAAIAGRLTDIERPFFDGALRSRGAEVFTSELLARSVDDAIAFVKDLVAQVRAERQATRPTAADGEPSGAALTERVMAIGALLDPEQRQAVLALLARLPIERCEQLKRTLLDMSIEEAAGWLREHLPELCAEAGLSP